jgi:hypothetical protein
MFDCIIFGSRILIELISDVYFQLSNTTTSNKKSYLLSAANVYSVLLTTPSIMSMKF